MKNKMILRSTVSVLVLCLLAFGAIRYSDGIGAAQAAALAAQQAAQEAAAQAEAQAAEEAARQAQEERAAYRATILAAQASLTELREAAAAKAADPAAEYVPADIYYPDTTPADIQELYDYYRTNYPDVIGYIYSPYTPINYPILRGTSTDDFYLHHDINGNEDPNGCIFLEHLNNQSFADDNSILYGHHMANGSMFASISYYKNSSYYYSHPYMYLLTPGQNYRLDLWAGIVCPHDDPVFATGHDAANRQSFYNRSTFKTALGAPEGRMVTLCTCSYEANNYRYCVLGNLVPIT